MEERGDRVPPAEDVESMKTRLCDRCRLLARLLTSRYCIFHGCAYWLTSFEVSVGRKDANKIVKNIHIITKMQYSNFRQPKTITTQCITNAATVLYAAIKCKLSRKTRKEKKTSKTK